MNYFLGFLWFIAATVFITGGKYQIPFQVTFLSTLASLVYYSYKSPRRFDSLLTALKKIPRGTVSVFVIVFFTVSCAALIFDYFSLNGTGWDLAQYLQVIKNYSTYNNPSYSFYGDTTNYYKTHNSTLSLFFLKWIYTLIPSASVALCWQGIWLFFAALVGVWAADQIWISKKSELRPYRNVLLLLVFLAGILNPAFSNQERWPYIFHIGVIPFLSLAYYFYAKQNYALWCVALMLLPTDKQDLGGIASAFGLLVFAEAIYKIIKKKESVIKNRSALFFGLLILFWGIGYYVYYSKVLGIGTQFHERFGSIAQTPGELIVKTFTQPAVIFGALTRVSCLKYFATFLFCSFIWLSPRAVFYFIPVLPHLILNCLADSETFHLLKDHYALPIGVGLLFTLILGVLPALVNQSKKPIQTALILLIAICFAQSFYSGQNVFRTLKESYKLSRDRHESRKMLDQLKAEIVKTKHYTDGPEMVCCSDRLCSYLYDLPILDLSRCDAARTINNPAIRTIWVVKYNYLPLPAAIATSQLQGQTEFLSVYKYVNKYYLQ